MDSPLDSFPSEDPSPLSSARPSLRARIRQACVRSGINRDGLASLLNRTRTTLAQLWLSLVAVARTTAGTLARGTRALTRASRASLAKGAASAEVVGRAIDTHADAMVRALSARARLAARAAARGIAGWRLPKGAGGSLRRPASAWLAQPIAAGVVPPHAPAISIRSNLWVIAIAAVTSAGVSLLTVWLWSPGVTAVGERAATTSNEPAEEASAMPEATPEPSGISSPAAAIDGTGTADGTQVARAAASAPSRLVVITQPAGARVTVDGVGWGVSPLTIRHLPPGARRVRVTKAGFRGEERVVRLDDAAAPTLRISLRRVADQRARASDASADH